MLVRHKVVLFGCFRFFDMGLIRVEETFSPLDPPRLKDDTKNKEPHHLLETFPPISLKDTLSVPPVTLTRQRSHHAYWVHDEGDHPSQPPVGVFKPQQEEENRDDLREGTVAGEGVFKELAAYVLDQELVPKTIPLMMTVPAAAASSPSGGSGSSRKDDQHELKFGSLQTFVPNEGSSDDFGSSRFSVESIHRIGILDVRIFNLDRHTGNMLVRTRSDGHGHYSCGSESMDIIPIDHGWSLPDWRYLSQAIFDWMDWKQSHSPFSAELVRHIAHLDEVADATLLRDHCGIRPECAFTNLLCTKFLKLCVVAKGKTLHEIAVMMTRDLNPDFAEQSAFERMVEACRSVHGDVDCYQPFDCASTRSFLETFELQCMREM